MNDLSSSREAKAKATKRRRTGGTGLNDLFIGVFGLCFLLSVSLNFLHDSGSIPHTHNTAVENAIQEFKTNAKSRMKKKTGSSLEANVKKRVLNLESQTKLAELNCEKFGGPSQEVAQEMVYWEDIPSDNRFVSPFFREGETKYLTFEPDGGGWNNIRMAMESVIGLAVAMGRTLVMPPQKKMYLLGRGDGKQRK
jgi:hypothetical protein